MPSDDELEWAGEMKRIETLTQIAGKIDEIQHRPVYDTQEAVELRVCEEWFKKFRDENESLHGMELVYIAFILWKIRWMHAELAKIDTDSNDTYYQTADEFIEGELIRAQC